MTKKALTGDLKAIVRRSAARPIVDPRPADVILGYADDETPHRDATDEEARAAIKRMMAKHRKSLERLAK